MDYYCDICDEKIKFEIKNKHLQKFALYELEKYIPTIWIENLCSSSSELLTHHGSICSTEFAGCQLNSLRLGTNFFIMLFF